MKEVLNKAMVVKKKKKRLGIKPCFTSLDMFQCLLVYSLWEFVYYCCVKTV